MATTNLARVESRERLKPRREPYWQRLEAGNFLGFRKMTADSTGAWVARSRDTDTGKQRHLALGEFTALPSHQRYDSAKRAADVWLNHLGLGGSTEAVTVCKACELNVEHVRADHGDRPADDMKMRFQRWVDNDKAIGELELAKLTKTKVEAWRKAMAKTPAKINRDNRAIPLTRPRAASSVNRDVAALRAALNFAHDAGSVTTDMAWRVALRPAKNADGRRDVYLDRDQRRQLIDKAEGNVGIFLRGLSLLPLRPGALAGLMVGNLDRRLGVLTIGKDKTGRDRKIKLPESTAKWFAMHAESKLPQAPLLSRSDGKAWDKDAWKLPVKAAAMAAELPQSTTAYTLRHSVITDLVTGGLDLLTVAQLSGTSVAMIERHYGHLRADHAAAALAKLAV
jgi:integrase